jgi:hypothetical protein
MFILLPSSLEIQSTYTYNDEAVQEILATNMSKAVSVYLKQLRQYKS